MTRALVALCVAAAVLVTGAAPAADAEAAKRKARKICVIKKQGRKAIRRPCRGPVKKKPAVKRTVAPAAAPAIGAPGLVPAADPAGDGVPATVPGEGAAVAGGVAPATCVPAASPWLGATAEDVGGVRLRLSRTCVPAGTVLVQLRNVDEQPHNLYAEGIAPAAPPREVVGDIDAHVDAQGSVVLAKGSWRFFCAIPGHEAMAATVTAG